METFQLDNVTLTINKEGGDRYSKVSYPARYGRYAEIRHSSLPIEILIESQFRGDIFTLISTAYNSSISLGQMQKVR